MDIPPDLFQQYSAQRRPRNRACGVAQASQASLHLSALSGAMLTPSSFYFNNFDLTPVISVEDHFT